MAIDNKPTKSRCRNCFLLVCFMLLLVSISTSIKAQNTNDSNENKKELSDSDFSINDYDIKTNFKDNLELLDNSKFSYPKYNFKLRTRIPFNSEEKDNNNDDVLKWSIGENYLNISIKYYQSIDNGNSQIVNYMLNVFKGNVNNRSKYWKVIKETRFAGVKAIVCGPKYPNNNGYIKRLIYFVGTNRGYEIELQTHVDSFEKEYKNIEESFSWIFKPQHYKKPTEYTENEVVLTKLGVRFKMDSKFTEHSLNINYADVLNNYNSAENNNKEKIKESFKAYIDKSICDTRNLICPINNYVLKESAYYSAGGNSFFIEKYSMDKEEVNFCLNNIEKHNKDQYNSHVYVGDYTFSDIESKLIKGYVGRNYFITLLIPKDTFYYQITITNMVSDQNLTERLFKIADTMEFL